MISRNALKTKGSLEYLQRKQLAGDKLGKKGQERLAGDTEKPRIWVAALKGKGWAESEV